MILLVTNIIIFGIIGYNLWLLAIIFFIIFEYSSRKPRWFRFTITSEQITRINCRQDGSVPWIMRLVLWWSKLRVSIRDNNIIIREVCPFKAVKGYRVEHDRFVLIPKHQWLNIIDFTIVPANNKEKIQSILNKKLERIK